MPPSYSYPDIKPAKYRIRNRGPWVTLEYSLFDNFSIGQTTALGDGAGCNFENSGLRNKFFTFFSDVSFHQPRQVHGAAVQPVNSAFSAGYPATDGLVCKLARTALTVLTADCLPVFILEQPPKKTPARRKRFGLIHAGRRGLEKNIVGRALEEYFSRLPVQVIVGAHVHQKSYPVNNKIIAKFSDLLDYSRPEMLERKIVTEENKLDLFKVLVEQITAVDADIGTIYRLDLNTAGNERIPLISYRQDKTEQRMLHWIFKED
ncbi:MAG: polyphenol oxidase family protein [bacterium]